MERMDFQEVSALIAQAAINIDEGITHIEKDSSIHKALHEFCRMANDGLGEEQVKRGEIQVTISYIVRRVIKDLSTPDGPRRFSVKEGTFGTNFEAQKFARELSKKSDQVIFVRRELKEIMAEFKGGDFVNKF